MKNLILTLTLVLVFVQGTKAQGHFELGATTNIFVSETQYDFDPLFSLKATGYFLKGDFNLGSFAEIGTTKFSDESYETSSLNVISFGLRGKYLLAEDSFAPYIVLEIGDSFILTEETLKSFTVRMDLGFEVHFKNSNSAWFLEAGYSFAQYGEDEFAFTRSDEVIGMNSLILSTGFRF